MRHALVAATVLALTTASAAAQQAVRLIGPSHVQSAGILRSAFAGPHTMLVADSGRPIELTRGTAMPRSVVIVGGGAAVAADVRGDLVVVGGDLFLRPGAAVEGRAIAIGGAVYRSTLAIVREGIVSVRDETYRVSRSEGGMALTYQYIGGRQPSIELPVLEGLRIPLYDRVDGASVPWGPLLRPTQRIEIEPFVTYRSHLGAWDPSVRAFARLSGPRRLTIDVGRFTRTNDAWIHSDLLNSATTLFGGSDTRNYYRADAAQVSVGRIDQYTYVEVERFGGVATERAWSVGAPDTSAALASHPWSVVSRDDPQGMARPNPPIDRGRISSAFLGALAQAQVRDVRIRALGRLEVPWEAPNDARFAQLTVDATVQFPTFGLQRFRSDLHVVATVGDAAPRQRFGYLGGSGTLPVIDEPLSLGGDQLLHLDSRYEIPVTAIRLPFVGSPVVALRHRIGSAGVGELPRFVQNLGLRLTVSFFKTEFSLDPASREHELSVGLSFAR